MDLNALQLPSTRVVLIAQREATTRERFAGVLEEAGHAVVPVDTLDAAMQAVGDRGRGISLVLVELTLSEDGPALVRALRAQAGHAVPVVVFSGSVRGAREVAALANMGISGFVNEHAAPGLILPALAPHLFPDNFNRRASPRVILGVPVSYQAGQTIAGAVTLDVTKGGLAIRTMNPLPPGAEVHLRFRLPGIVADIDADGRVAWSDRKVGMGVQFEALAAADQAAIDSFVDEHQR